MVNNTFSELLKSFNPHDIEKFNPYHDPASGRFTTGPKTSGSGSIRSASASISMDDALEEIAGRVQRGEITSQQGMEEYRRLQNEAKAAELKSFKPAESSMEAAKYARETLGFISADFSYSVNYQWSSLDVDTCNAINETISEIQVKFPEVNGTIHRLEMSNANGDYAAFVIHPNPYSKALQVSGKLYSKGIDEVENVWQRDVEAGFHPPGTTGKSVLWHEYGHVLATQAAEKASDRIPSKIFNDRTNNITEKGWIRKAVEKVYSSEISALPASQRESFISSRVDTYGDNISVYAKKNAAECFAEAFAEYYTSPNPRPAAIALVEAAGLGGR